MYYVHVYTNGFTTERKNISFREESLDFSTPKLYRHPCLDSLCHINRGGCGFTGLKDKTFMF